MRAIHSLLLTVSAGFLLGVAHASTGLQWDTKQTDLKPRAVDAVAEAKFTFVNAGAEAVTIESVKSSCGCTVPNLEKTTYAGGERGELVARFTIGDRRGFQSANIFVAIKGQTVPTTLTLNVTIPEAAKLTPAVLFWDAGVAAGPKGIDVEALPGQPIEIGKVTVSAPEFQAKVEIMEKNAKYRIIVTPVGTEKPAFAMLDIEIRTGDGAKMLRAFAQVRAKPATPRQTGQPALTPPPQAGAEPPPAVALSFRRR